ncbi:hypothetical protein M434DRAFT_38831 [Hypoxylon sp. CO27-5]|nr:hypothetical protein M434DRAFT_38831 [Hypoxylon sp. CO27-5]
MASESTTDAVYNGKKPLNSNTTSYINDNRRLKAARLEAFIAAPSSTIVALDIKPQDIQTAHEALDTAAIMRYTVDTVGIAIAMYQLIMIFVSIKRKIKRRIAKLYYYYRS